jgi:hypothetical protein
LAHLVVRQQPLARATEPIQSILLLMRLRDTLVHLKPFVSSATDDGLTTSRDGVLRALHAKHLLPGNPSKEARNLTAWLDQAKVSAWAIQSVRAGGEFLFSLIPPSAGRDYLDGTLEAFLQIPPRPNDP